MSENEVKTDNEKRMLVVILFTIFAMIAEIYFGHRTNSMSLQMEGWHMSLHVLTLGLTYVAYVFARKLKDSPLFANGTGKIGVLAGYTSALFLSIMGLHIMFESFMRFFEPEEISFNEAILAAIFALVINYICIAVMEDKFHLHKHIHKETKDYNYKAAYYHILSDVMISVLTIIALVIGKYTDCIHLDALTGIFGAVLILVWSFKLLKNTVKILIDMKA